MVVGRARESRPTIREWNALPTGRVHREPRTTIYCKYSVFLLDSSLSTALIAKDQALALLPNSTAGQMLSNTHSTTYRSRRGVSEIVKNLTM